MTLPINDTFENLETITFGETNKISFEKKKTLSDGSTEIIENYDIFYKPVIEKTLDWNFTNEDRWNDILDKKKSEESEKYESSNLEWNNQQYITPSNSEGYTPMPKIANVFNIKNFRNRLTTKIKVSKLTGTYWYDIGSQKIVEFPSELENVDSFEYDKSHFKQITDPYIFNPSINTEIADILPINYIMVLPYITKEDIDTDSTITFLNDTEILPEWKKQKPLDWKAYTTYSKNDVIYYNKKYYQVLSNFTSGETFEITSNMVRVSEKEAFVLLKPLYYPTLDLAYIQSETVRNGLTILNTEEAQGNYWTNEEFANWEIIFEPIFNKNIDNIGIKIYNPNNTRKVEFQLI